MGAFQTVNGRIFSLRLAYVNIVMLGSIFLAMSQDFATLPLVKKVPNLQHKNLPIQDINFPTKNSESPDLGSRMYHMYGSRLFLELDFLRNYCANLNQTLYESFQVEGNENLIT